MILRELTKELRHTQHLIHAFEALAESRGVLMTEAARQLDAAGREQVAYARRLVGHYQRGWPALAPATVAEKTRKGFSPPDQPLLRTGELRDSYDHFVSESAGGHLALVVGSTDKTAVFHELGTIRVPPRPVLVPTAVAHIDRVAAILGERIAGMMILEFEKALGG